MVFVILIYYFFLFLPLVCFLVAAVAEIRSYNRELGFPLRMLEIVAGIIFALAIPSKFWNAPILSTTLSWTMVWTSLLLGGLSLVSRYGSRVALFFVLLGSASLAFLWYFNGAYMH